MELIPEHINMATQNKLKCTCLGFQERLQIMNYLLWKHMEEKTLYTILKTKLFTKNMEFVKVFNSDRNQSIQ